MLRTTFKGLVAHKFRLFATSLAVMLGVAFTAGTLVLTDTIQKTFDDLFSDIYDDTDAVVRAEGAFDSEGIEQRGRVDASLLDTVSGVDGVAVAQPDIRGYAQLVDRDGDAVGDPENGPPTLGGNWIDSEELNGFRLADAGISQTEIVRRIAPELPTGTEAVTGEEITKESQDEIEQGLSFFNTFMLVFAVIALLVGGFIIFNTFFITVAQRTQENALLRALGARKRQVLVSVLLEALAVGVIASVVGIGAGILVAAALKALLAALGFELPAGGIVVTANTVIA